MLIQPGSPKDLLRVIRRFVSALRLSDEDIEVLTGFPEAGQAAEKAIKEVVASPNNAFCNLLTDTRRGMGGSYYSPVVNIDALQKLFSALDITYKDMEAINSSAQARQAVRRAIRAIIAPPKVVLLRARLRGGRLHTPSDFYRAALNLDVNQLLGQERLTEAGRKAIRFRFGFVTGQPETLEATADHFSLTREQLRELIDEAFDCLSWKWMRECGADI